MERNQTMAAPLTRLDRRLLLTRFAPGAVLGASGLAGRRRTAAQEATPGSTPAPDEMIEATRGTVQFIHPEKVYFYLPGSQNEAVVASIYGLEVEPYQAIKADFAAVTQEAAEELLADSGFAERVDRLPFQPDALVVAIGESDTDDLQSWFEILRHLIDLRRPQDGIRLLNLAVSGQTTADAFGQLIPALMQEPDWILCGIGGNDAVRSGTGATKTMLSLAETELNLTELRTVAAAQSDVNWVWLTRWSIDEGLIASYPGFQMGQFSLRAEDFDAVSDLVRRQPDPVVDLGSIFGRPPSLEFLAEDGLHPSLAGQQLIAKTVVEQLTA